MVDFEILSGQEFLKFYSDVTEDEYEATASHKFWLTGIVDLKPSYNGDLGVLQHKVSDTIKFIERLLINNFIDRVEYDYMFKTTIDYFASEINKVNKCSMFYIR